MSQTRKISISLILLDSNYSDGESFYQKYADLTGDPNWLAREYMDDEEIQEYGIDSDYDWF